MKGYLLAALAAAFYGTNPVFAVPLYNCGMSSGSVLLFRYLLGIPILAALIIIRAEPLLLHAYQVVPVAAIGIIMGISSLALYESYNYMNPGIASTLLFMYPLLTSLIMTIFFHEKLKPITIICLSILCIGLYLLMNDDNLNGFNLTGFILIFISSLTYAIYLVTIKISSTIQTIPLIQSLLYQLLFGSLIFIIESIFKSAIIIPHTIFEWSNLLALALIPTVLSLLFTINAIKYIGPTSTALFGALEPITAVILSVVILGETIKLREIVGGILIVLATTLIVVADKNSESKIN